MTLKMYELTNFPAFYEKIRSEKLPFKTSYHLALLAQEVEKHINYYQEQFRNILMDCGKKDDNGNFIPSDDGQGIMLIDEKANEAYEKIAELRNLEVALPDYIFSVEDFAKVELTLEEMAVIMPFIKD
jgi:hypothetical protein